MAISNKNLIDRTDPENLKKVEEIRTRVTELNNAINEAYANKRTYEIDRAVEAFFTYLDSINISKDNDFYVQMRNYTWQKNHVNIIASISKLMQEYNRMPTTTEISSECGLSEETIYKHLREFKEHDLAIHETEKYKFMVDRVLAKVLNLCEKGDIKACKVYLDYFKPTNEIQQSNYHQNNFIQFNSLKLSFEDLSNLPNDVKSKMEKIILNPTYFENIEIVL